MSHNKKKSTNYFDLFPIVAPVQEITLDEFKKLYPPYDPGRLDERASEFHKGLEKRTLFLKKL